MTDDIAIKARRRTGGLVAVAITAAVVIIAMVVGLGTWLDRTSLDSARGKAGGSEVAGNRPAALDPDDLRWVDLIGVQLPVSATTGPRDTAGGLARGFSHDERGAVFAALHLSFRAVSQVGPAIFGPTLRDQVVGADAAALREHVELSYELERVRAGAEPGATLGRSQTVLRGYRVDAYTASLAAIRLLVEGRDTRGDILLAVAVVQVQWTGRDWALVAPPGGRWDGTVSLAADTTGFTELSPQGPVR